MQAGFRSPLLGLLLVASLVFGIERLIVTDAEEIEHLAGQVGRTIQDGDWDGLEALLHEDFRYEGRDRAATVAHVRALVRKYRPTGVRITVYDIRVDGDDAQARGVVQGTALGRTVPVRVDAVFRHDGEDWKLLQVSGGGYVR